MTEEELAQYGMKRVGNTFTQTTGNPQIGSAQPRLPGPTPGSAVGPNLRPNWVPGGGSIPVGQATELGTMRLPAPGSIPVGQATELGGVRMPAPGSIPVGQATEVGQHQMWVAQAYPLRRPRQWLTSGGLGTMGFGVPAAIGAALAEAASSGTTTVIDAMSVIVVPILLLTYFVSPDRLPPRIRLVRLSSTRTLTAHGVGNGP